MVSGTTAGVLVSQAGAVRTDSADPGLLTGFTSQAVITSQTQGGRS